MESALKKIQLLESANAILMSDREELTEKLKEKTRSEDFYHQQYLLLTDEISRIPSWIKSLYGV